MASSKEKKIETLQVILETEGSFSFDELIINPEVVEREFRVHKKDVSLRILNKNNDTIIGLVETSRNDNVPPKKSNKSKKIERLGLADGEGLAYANIFIYERKRKLIMYEVNKFGCSIDHFIQYIYKCCKKSETFSQFNIKLNAVLKEDEYKRLQSMRFHKSLELEVANPKKIIADYEHKHDAFWNICSSGAKLDSTKIVTKLEVRKQDGAGLASVPLLDLVDRALEVLRSTQGENVKKIKVYGYESDGDSNKLSPIDLIADRYLKTIKLNEPRENTDLLEGQRSKEIKALYDKCRTDFDAMFGK